MTTISQNDLIESIAAALQSYGVKPNRMPLSPPRIWEMLNPGSA